MNYLAHLFLSGSDPGILVGNFLGDAVRNRDLPRYPQRVRTGIMLHRQIDSFTDRHPMVLRGVRRMYPQHGKYGAVLIDVFYDHLLTANWSLYSRDPFPAFRQRVYRTLMEGRQYMDPDMRARVQRMTQSDWLASYADLEGIGHSIGRMKRRASRPAMLDGAVDFLQEHFEAYDAEFQAFFPEMISFVDAALT